MHFWVHYASDSPSAICTEALSLYVTSRTYWDHLLGVCVSEEVDSRNVTQCGLCLVRLLEHMDMTSAGFTVCSYRNLPTEQERETVSWQTFSNNTPCAALQFLLWIQAMSLVWNRHMHPWPERGIEHAGRSVPEQQETERLANANISTTLTQNYHLHTVKQTTTSSPLQNRFGNCNE